MANSSTGKSELSRNKFGEISDSITENLRVERRLNLAGVHHFSRASSGLLHRNASLKLSEPVEGDADLRMGGFARSGIG